MMKRVEFFENREYLKIVIRVKDSQYWILPMLLFMFFGFCCGLALISISLMGHLRKIDIPIFFKVLSVFLYVTCGYGIISWLFNTYGKEILILDNKRTSFSYKKSLFKIGISKRFNYQDISTFIASDSLLPYPLRRRTDIWARCEFNYKGNKIRFGFLKTLDDATKIIDKINQYIGLAS